MVRVSTPAKLRPCSELTAKMVMGVVPGLVTNLFEDLIFCLACSVHLSAADLGNFSGIL